MSRPRRNLGVDLLDSTSAPQSDGNMASYEPEADRRTQSDHVIEQVPLELIDRSPYQHRVDFDDEQLVQLAESIGPDGAGLLQPPTVRRMSNGRYQLVAGERRVRAAKLNRLSALRVQVREMTDEEAQEAACRENIDRATLLPWETCMAYLAMRDLARTRVRDNAGAGVVARMWGKHQRSVVANYLEAGEAVSRSMLLRAGAGMGRADDVDPLVLRALTLTDLLSVAARATEEERLDRLAALVTAIRGGERTTSSKDGVSLADADEAGSDERASRARSSSGRRRRASRTREGGEHTYDSLMRQGRFQKCIRSPIERMRAAEARKHLDSLTPVVAALAMRALAEDAASVVDLQAEGAPVTLLAVRADDGRWLDALRAWLSSDGEGSAPNGIATAPRA